MAYEITPDDLEWLKSQTSSSEGQEANFKPSPEMSLGNRIKEIALATRIPQFGTGIAQSTLGGIESVANLPLELIGKGIGKDITLPEINLGKYLPQDPASRMAYQAGEIGGAVLPFMGTMKALGAVGKAPQLLAEYKSLAPALRRMLMGEQEAATALPEAESILSRKIPTPMSVERTGATFPNILTQAGKGAAAGYLTGEQTPGEMSQRNLGALLGSVGGAGESVVANKMAKRLAENFKKSNDLFTSKYNDLWQDIKSSGLDKNKLEIPSTIIDTKTNPITKPVYKSLSVDLKRSSEKFASDPTFDTAHKFQSDLGKEARNIDRTIASIKRSPSGKEALSNWQDKRRIVSEMQDSLRNKMSESLHMANRGDLSNRYNALTEAYARYHAPYKIPEMEGYLQGKTSSGDLVRALQRSGSFQESGLGKQVPGYGTRRAASLGWEKIPEPIRKYGIPLTGLGLATKAGLPIPGMYYLSQLLGGH